MLLGGVGGRLGRAKAPPIAPGGCLGGLGGSLRAAFGALRAALRDRAAPSEATVGQQAALQNHVSYYIKLLILALRGYAGGPWVEVHSDEGPKPRDGTRGTLRGALALQEKSKGGGQR